MEKTVGTGWRDIPQWRMKKMVRQGQHISLKPGQLLDLTAPPYNLEYEDAENQPNILHFLDRQFIRLVPESELASDTIQELDSEQVGDGSPEVTSEETSDSVSDESDPVQDEDPTEGEGDPKTAETNPAPADDSPAGEEVANAEAEGSETDEGTAEAVSEEPAEVASEDEEPVGEHTPGSLNGIKGIGAATIASLAELQITTLAQLKEAVSNNTLPPMVQGRLAKVVADLGE